MAQRSPTLEGFRVIFRHPSLTLAEVAWRWSFWGAVTFLFGVLFVEYFDSLPVGPRDLLFLDSGQPTLIGKALAHIFRDSSLRLAIGATIVVAGAGLAWTIVGAIGRSASLRAIREYVSGNVSSDSEHPSRSVRSLVGINLLRLMLALATFIACIGAFVLPTRIFAPYHPKPGLLFLWTILLFSIVVFVWLTLNCTLALAAVFAVRDGKDSFRAMAAAAIFSRERSGGLWAINLWFGLMHVTVFVIGTTVASSILGMAQVLPAKLILSAIFVVTLLYFVLADAIHVGRMAAWFCLADISVLTDIPPALISFQPEPVGMSLPSAPTQTIWSEFPPEDDILSEIESRFRLQNPPESDS